MQHAYRMRRDRAVMTNTLSESDAERKEDAVAKDEDDRRGARVSGHEGEVPGHEHRHRGRQDKEVPPGEQKPSRAGGGHRGWWPGAGHRA